MKCVVFGFNIRAYVGDSCIYQQPEADIQQFISDSRFQELTCDQF